MAWPFTPLTTYISDSTPAIKAFDLNNFQFQTNVLSEVLYGSAFKVEDDFTGDTLNQGIWVAPLGIVSLTPDNANGGLGAVLIAQGGTGLAGAARTASLFI